MQRTGVPRRRRARLRRSQRADLTKCGFHFFDHEIDHVQRAFFAQGAKPPQKGLAGKRSFGAKHKRAHHIQSRTHAAVEHHDRPTPNSTSNGGKHVDRRRQGLDLPPAVIGDDEAVNAKRNTDLRIGWMKYPFHHQRPFPALAISGDFIPSKGAPHLAADEAGHLVHVGVVASIWLEVAEARLTVPP
jgi:hypothetical protein